MSTCRVKGRFLHDNLNLYAHCYLHILGKIDALNTKYELIKISQLKSSKIKMLKHNRTIVCENTLMNSFSPIITQTSINKNDNKKIYFHKFV